MRIFLAALACLFASNAGAATVTFDHDIGTDPSVPGGFLGASQGFEYLYDVTYLSGDHIYLHDDSGITSSRIAHEQGSVFSAHSIDVRGYSRVYKTGSGPIPGAPTDASEWGISGLAPLPFLNFYGLRDGAVVASQAVAPSEWSTVLFDATFRLIDQLYLTLSIPSAIMGQDSDIEFPATTSPNTVWCPQWCAGFQVDNLEVSIAPVPVPAGGFLLFTALLGLVGYIRFNLQR